MNAKARLAGRTDGWHDLIRPAGGRPRPTVRAAALLLALLCAVMVTACSETLEPGPTVSTTPPREPDADEVTVYTVFDADEGHDRTVAAPPRTGRAPTDDEFPNRADNDHVGAEQSAVYALRTQVYGLQSGDSGPFESVIGADCTGCAPALEAITALTASGGYYSGGDVNAEILASSHYAVTGGPFDAYAEVDVRAVFDDAVVYEDTAGSVRAVAGQTQDFGIDLVHADGAWSVVRFFPLEDE